MKKCNCCGREADIVLESLIDGKVCYSCAVQYFNKLPNGTLIPKYYNMQYLNELLNRFSRSTQEKVHKAFKFIQSKYEYKISHYDMENDIMKIYCESKYRRKPSVISIEINGITERVEYNITSVDEYGEQKVLAHQVIH